MADISDVENAIVSLIANTLYPQGWSVNNLISKIGVQAVIRRGWPTPNDLDTALTAGIVCITVFSRNESESNKTRYPVRYQGTAVAPTFTATVVNNTIAVGGLNNTAVNQYLTVLIGSRVVVSYQIKTTDTAATIAQGISTLIIAQGYACTVSNSTVTVNFGGYLQAIFGTSEAQIAEIKRQSLNMQIVIWCPNPTLRDTAGSLLDPVLAETTFLTLADNTAARFRYVGTYIHDDAQKVKLYRRDLIYQVEYATTITDAGYGVTSINTDIQAGTGALGTGPDNNFYHPFPPS